MLSNDLREMRREFQNALLDAGEYVQISVLHLQSYALALAMYEDEVRDMEHRLASLPAQTVASGTAVIPFPISQPKRLQLTVIHGDGGDVA